MNPYIVGGVVVPKVDQLPEVRHRCPACSWSFKTTDIDAFRGFHVKFMEGTILYCSPERRLRFGFMRLRSCSEPGEHTHQKCNQCGWAGISRVMDDN